ncbi:MAG: hypothetical protein AB1798_02965 [Spirochaetota bacterium]
MKKVPVFSSDKMLNKKITAECEKFESYLVPMFFQDRDRYLEYLKFELPEINIINFDENDSDIFSILEDIKADSWLHYGGIIGIHGADNERELLEKMRDSNIISILRKGEFDFNFHRILKIIKQNRRILFQRGFQSDFLNNITETFVMDNDPFDVKVYANLVSNFLYNANYINNDSKERL